MKRKIKWVVVLTSIHLTISGCADVKAFQMSTLHDESMQTNAQQLEKLENEAESYREGSSGGVGGKTGGGCGCN